MWWGITPPTTIFCQYKSSLIESEANEVQASSFMSNLYKPPLQRRHPDVFMRLLAQWWPRLLKTSMKLNPHPIGMLPDMWLYRSSHQRQGLLLQPSNLALANKTSIPRQGRGLRTASCWSLSFHTACRSPQINRTFWIIRGKHLHYPARQHLPAMWVRLSTVNWF